MEATTRKIVDTLAEIFNTIYQAESELSYKCKLLEHLMLYLGYNIDTKDTSYYADTKTANKFAHDVMVILAKDQSDKEK